MGYHIPLNEMTIIDKLEAMERLWEDFCRSPEEFLPPAWHENVLSSREKRVGEGSAKFSTLAEVKDRIRKTSK